MKFGSEDMGEVGEVGGGINTWKEPKDLSHSGIVPNIAGKWGAPDWVDVFPIKNGDIPASYVSLPEGNKPCNANMFLDWFPTFTSLWLVIQGDLMHPFPGKSAVFCSDNAIPFVSSGLNKSYLCRSTFRKVPSTQCS